MTTLEEIRNKYPEYDNVTDQVLADKLHSKYYSNIPKDEYYSKIGMPQVETKPASTPGFKGVAKDVVGGALQAPGLLGSALMSLPGEVLGAGQQSLLQPGRALSNVAAGAGEFGTGVANIPSTVAKYLAEKQFISPESAQSVPRLSEFDYPGAYGIEGEQRGDILLRGAAEAPFWSLPGGALKQAAKFTTLGAAHEINPITLAATEGLGRLGGKAVVKGAEKLKGIAKIPEKLSKPLPEKIASLEKSAKESGIRTFAGDISSEALPVRATRSSESVPFVNINAERALQRGEASKAANLLTGDLKQKMIQSEFAGKNGLERIKTIADGGGKRAKAAKDLLIEIDASGEDWNKIIKTGGQSKVLLNKVKADALYDHVGELSKKAGEKVDLSKTVNIIDKHISTLSKAKSINKSEISLLDSIKKDLKGNKLDFNDARKFRGFFMDKISDYYGGKNSLVGKSGVTALQEVKNILESDIEKFTANSSVPELKNVWKQADKYYKENVIPFKDSALAKVLKAESNPDEIYKSFIRNGGSEGDLGTGRAKKFFSALDDKGRDAVRYGMVKEAFGKAVKGGEEKFSPANFANSLKAIESSRAVFFKGADKKRIKGLINVMDHIKAAGEVVPPKTGFEAVKYLLAGYGLQAPANAAKLLGGAYVLKQLVTTDAGKKFLINSSNLKVGSKAFDKNLRSSMDKISKNISKAAAIEVSQKKGSEE